MTTELEALRRVAEALRHERMTEGEDYTVKAWATAKADTNKALSDLDALPALAAVLPLAVAEEREQCAKVADLYEKELTRMAVDTWMCDPIRTGDNSPAAQERSLELGEEGWRKGERAETACHIADAIRSRGEPR